MAVCGRCFVCGSKFSCRHPLKCESCAKTPDEMPAFVSCAREEQAMYGNPENYRHEHKICAGCLDVLHGVTGIGDEEGRGVAIVLMDRLAAVLRPRKESP